MLLVIERQGQNYGFSVNDSSPYPLKELNLANRVMVLARQERWCEEYVRRAYMHWFLDGYDVGGDENLTKTLSEIGQ